MVFPTPDMLTASEPWPGMDVVVYSYSGEDGLCVRITGVTGSRRYGVDVWNAAQPGRCYTTETELFENAYEEARRGMKLIEGGDEA